MENQVKTPVPSTNKFSHDVTFLKSLLVLCVEDDDDTREQLSLFLPRYAGELVIAGNGEEGLLAYHARKPDIIITDIQMPIMDGLAMTREIRNSNRNIPIIALTAYDQSDNLTKAADAGIDSFVTKPIDLYTLVDLLQVCADRLLMDKMLSWNDRISDDDRSPF
jgi:two-component system, cell cycle response regulator